jgi:hypothetical protein
MKIAFWSLPVVLGVSLAGWAGVAPTRADDPPQEVPATAAAPSPEHTHGKSELHGGKVTMTKDHHFETRFAADGVRVFIYTANQAPQMVEKAKGEATLEIAGRSPQETAFVVQKPLPGESTVYFCPMHENVVQKEPGVCAACGGMKLFAQDYLFAKADLGAVAPGALEAMVHIEELKGSEPEVVFSVTNAVEVPNPLEGEATPQQSE